MGNDVLISVIIPVYNVEKYLKQCLNSVMFQDYKNLEIICIDDCSTDSSLEILKTYASEDKRIKIVQNAENLGVGLTRNEGLKIATGEYIHFLDPDDFLNSNAYNQFQDLIKDVGQADAFVFSYNIYNERTKKNILKNFKLSEDLCNKKNNFTETPDIIEIWEFQVWTKIIKAQFLRDNLLYFNDNRCQEDIEFSMQLLLKANSIVFNKNPLLTYRENRKFSLVSNRFKYFDLLINDINKLEGIIENYPLILKQRFLSIIHAHLIICASEAFYKGDLSFKDLKELINKKVNIEILIYSNKYKYHVNLYDKIIKYNEIQFRLSYCLREFLKQYFPNYVAKYFTLKRIIKGEIWMKI